MQQLVELVGRDAQDGLLRRDHPLGDHLRRDADRGRRSALAGARLQEVERAALHRELDVLHVAVVPLEAVLRGEQLLVCTREPVGHLVDAERCPDAGDDVLALRVDEELTVELPFARARVARERHAGTGVVPQVAEHHADDVHAGAKVVGDARVPTVIHRFLERPRLPDGLDRAPELFHRVHREVVADGAADQRLVFLDEVAVLLLGEVGVVLDAGRHPLRRQDLLELGVAHPEYDVAIHLDEAAIGVVREARLAARLREAVHRAVVEAEVEDRLHHPRHRERGAAADRDEQRIGRIAEPLAAGFLEPRQVAGHFLAQAVAHDAVGEVADADVARDGEPRRHGHAEVRHLGEVRTLPAEDGLHVLRAFGAAVPEEVDGGLHAFRRW